MMIDLGNWNYSTQRRLRHHPQTSADVSSQISNILSLLEICALTHPVYPAAFGTSAPLRPALPLLFVGKLRPGKVHALPKVTLTM